MDRQLRNSTKKASLLLKTPQVTSKPNKTVNQPKPGLPFVPRKSLPNPLLCTSEISISAPPSSQPLPDVSISNCSTASVSTNMAATLDNLGLDMDLSGLSNESQLLAKTIVTSLVTYMEQQFTKEREAYEAKITSLENTIQSLRDEQDDLENYGRRNIIVLSGSSLPTAPSDENCIDTATKIITEKLGMIDFRRTDIDVAHRLGKPHSGTPDKRNIIVKLCRRENKQKIFQACRIKKPQNLFFSESVSRTRSTILYVLRKARKDYPSKFGLCKAEDGNVRVFLPSPGDPSRTIKQTVNTKKALDILLRTRINADSNKFEPRWASDSQN